MDIANYYCELAANELAHARPAEASALSMARNGPIPEGCGWVR